ncbi:hypothetical protein [Candidatus Harpocratesius sp.]
MVENSPPVNINGEVKFFNLDYSHPYKRTLLKYIIISLVIMIIIQFINYTYEIFGFCSKFIYIFSIITIVSHFLVLLLMCFQPLYNYSSDPPEKSYNILVRDFQSIYRQIASILPQIQPKKPQNKRILIKIYYFFWILLIVFLFFFYKENINVENDKSLLNIFYSGIFFLIMITFLIIFNVIDNNLKRKIHFAKLLQQEFIKYYNQIGLEFRIEPGEYKNPGYGIEIFSTSINKGYEVLELIKIGRQLLYFVGNTRIFAAYLILPIIMVFLTPFSFNLSNMNEFLIMIISDLGFLIFIIICIHKINYGNQLKLRICTVLGIKISSFEEISSEIEIFSEQNGIGN